jgi:membrane associated rhomboid family serine protease
MGIQDRDYYRNTGPSIFDSLMPRGLVCRWLIGINVAIFFLQLVSQTAALNHGDEQALGPPTNGVVTEWLILDVQKVLHGQVWRLLTYAFLHDPNPGGYFLHIIFNMIFLWWFGSDVEQLYGPKEFLAIYLTSAFLGGVTYEAWGLLPQTRAGPCLGASGAVTTMLFLCALHYPRRIIHLWFFPMPIWLFALFNFLRDAAGVFGMGDRGIAFCVHLAGAGFAVGYYQWQGSIVQSLSGLLWWKNTRSRARLKLFNPDAEEPEPVAVSAHSASTIAMDEHLEAKLDAILEKINKTGKDSLTDKEQEILRRAAEMYKRRRT